jgi:hypothetical protein
VRVREPCCGFDRAVLYVWMMFECTESTVPEAACHRYNLCTACFNTQEFSFFLLTLTLVFVSCNSDNKQQLFSLNSMKWLGLIRKTPCPSCEDEIEFQ